jgi:hypothetical protein
MSQIWTNGGYSDPHTPVGAPVESSQLSEGRYVLGLLLNHNTCCHRHWESWLHEVKRDPSYSRRICRKKHPHGTICWEVARVPWVVFARFCCTAGIHIRLGVHTRVWTAAKYNSWEMKVGTDPISVDPFKTGQLKLGLSGVRGLKKGVILEVCCQL